MLCVHTVCIGFLRFYHPQTLPRGLTGVLFLLLSPLPCLSLAPGDDTLLEFTSCCCQEGKRERVAMLYRSLFARHPLTRTIWCLLFLHSFLYPSCSLLLFLHPPQPHNPPVYAVFLSGLWLFNIICLESSLCAGVSTASGVAVGAVNDLQWIFWSGGPRFETFFCWRRLHCMLICWARLGLRVCIPLHSLLTPFKTIARHCRHTMCGVSPVDVWQRGMVGLPRNPLEAFKGTTSSSLAAPRHAVDWWGRCCLCSFIHQTLYLGFRGKEKGWKGRNKGKKTSKMIRVGGLGCGRFRGWVRGAPLTHTHRPRLPPLCSALPPTSHTSL